VFHKLSRTIWCRRIGAVEQALNRVNVLRLEEEKRKETPEGKTKKVLNQKNKKKNKAREKR